jgi:hypothetical protein
MLPSGVANARVVIHDPATGALGAVTQRIEVPAATAFRISTPILTDTVDKSARVPRRRSPCTGYSARTASSSASSRCWASSKGPQGPRIASGMELRTAGGTVVRKAELTPIAADPDGRVVRLIGMGLADLKEGRYELVLSVRDQVGGETIERREEFSLIPPS